MFVLLKLLSLQARYYSISSSPRANANTIAVTAVVLEYKIDERHIKGVCTNYLKGTLLTQRYFECTCCR